MNKKYLILTLDNQVIFEKATKTYKAGWLDRNYKKGSLTVTNIKNPDVEPKYEFGTVDGKWVYEELKCIPYQPFKNLELGRIRG